MKVRNAGLLTWAAVWQPLAPQVAARLSGCVEERGSLAGRLWCAVWQSEHIAALSRPTVTHLPWKLSLKLLYRSAWQSPQSDGMCARAWTVFGSSTAWAWWQVLHTGPSLPSRHSAPWTLSSHSLSVPLWHWPQVSGLLACDVRAPGVSWRWMSWLPWQSLQAGDISVRPARNSARACTLDR